MKKSKKLIALTMALAIVTSTTGSINVMAAPTVNNTTVGSIMPSTITDTIKQALSSITDVVKRYTTSYAELPTKYDVSKTKNFEIKFNREINFISVNSNTVKVVDSKGNEVAVKLSPKTTDKTVVIVEAPTGGYKEGETYALIVRKGINSLNSFKLVDETVMKFVIAAGTTSGGSTGGTPQTTGTNRILSVEYKGTTVKNNNPFDVSKTYSAVTDNNILNKDKILVNMSINGMQKTYYNVIADYQKSQSAFEKIDILEPIFMRKEDFASYNLTVNFGTDIDNSTVVSGNTVYSKAVFLDQGFVNPINEREIGTIIKSANSIELQLKHTGEDMTGITDYIFINGVKDKKGNTLKPMIIPIFIPYENNRATVTSDNILLSKTGDESWEWVSKINNFNCTSLGFKYDTILDWDRISVAVNNDFSNYQDLIKEVRDRLPRYEIMYHDMRHTGIFPTNGLKGYQGYFSNVIYIWDRFTYNGKNVDVLAKSDTNNIFINIYDRGTSWVSNPNAIQPDFGIPYSSTFDKVANWQYNFNKATMDSWTYK